jgi:hypothetical protein
VKQLRGFLAWAGAVVLLRVAGPSPVAVPRTSADWHRTLVAHPERLLLLGAALLAWVLLAWIGLAGLALFASRLPGGAGRRAGRIAAVLLPRALRAALEGALGLSLAIGTTGPAFAASNAGPPPIVDRPVVSSIQLSPLPRVPAPVVAPPMDPSPEPLATPDRPVTGAHEVHPGDSLWSIAADALGADASDARVASAWQRWYAANRLLIGPDPGLLRPGQRLQPPTG